MVVDVSHCHSYLEYDDAWGGVCVNVALVLWKCKQWRVIILVAHGHAHLGESSSTPIVSDRHLQAVDGS